MPTPYILDNTRETCNFTSFQNPIQLLGNTQGKLPFSYLLGDQDTVLYCINDLNGNWESGVGTFSIVGLLYFLSRDTIISSTNGDQMVDFPGGVKIIESVLDSKIAQQLLDLIPYPFW